MRKGAEMRPRHTMRYLFFASVGLWAGLIIAGTTSWLIEDSMIGLWSMIAGVSGIVMLGPLAGVCSREAKGDYDGH
jgi:hypothetical protein